MSGAGGLIIIVGKKADGSQDGTGTFPAATMKALWDSIPDNQKTTPTWIQVEAIINNSLT